MKNRLKTIPLLSLACWFLFTSFSASASELDQHARALETPLPEYPEIGPWDIQNGIVSVLFSIDEKGTPTLVRTMNSSSPKYEEAVIEATSKWTFKHGIIKNKPVSDTLEFIVVFDRKHGVQLLGPLYVTE